jgi:hypothetical protein
MGSTGVKSKSSVEFRLIPRIETFPVVVSFAQTSFGKAALIAAFGLGMRFFLPDLTSGLPLILALALMTFMPEYRRFILAITPITLVLVQYFQVPILLGSTLTVVALGIFLYWCAMRWPKSRFGQRPLVSLLASLTLLIVIACATAPNSLTHSILWSLVSTMAS